ncbi:hypothetical protein CLD22_26100, partial [Rubrivivax gelatinosus]|nr:hypothetical protein [Rubrivivax gelatinosus]
MLVSTVLCLILNDPSTERLPPEIRLRRRISGRDCAAMARRTRWYAKVSLGLCIMQLGNRLVSAYWNRRVSQCQPLLAGKVHMEAKKRGPGRPQAISAKDRRAKILETAGGLFIEDGYGSTNMEKIALRCGMSKKTL